MSVAQGDGCHPLNKCLHPTSDLKEGYHACVIPPELILAHVVVVAGNRIKFLVN